MRETRLEAVVQVRSVGDRNKGIEGEMEKRDDMKQYETTVN